MKSKLLIIAVIASVFALSAATVFATEEFSAYINVTYNASDASDNIRKAIIQAKANPGREKIILSSQGNDTTTWISGPIYLGNDMELHLEEGVTLQAKSGAFSNENQPFINIEEKTDVKISGADRNTSKIKMLIDEYESGSNRHSISILGSKNVTVTGLYLDKSGGDGICVNDKYYKSKALTAMKNDNVLIENIICDASARNGISVISGNNITVDNCKAVNIGKSNPVNLSAGGPWSGITIEPERSRPLNNITVRNCLFENTRGRGIDLAMFKLCDTNNFSLNIIGCEVKNCPRGIVAGSIGKNGEIKGSVNFKNCIVSGVSGETVVVRSWENDAASLDFKDCAFINPSKAYEGVFIFRESTLANNTGNVNFENVFVFNDKETNKARYIINLSNSGGNLIPGPITGTIKYNNASGTVLYGSEEDEKDGMKVEFIVDAATTQEEFIEDIGFTGYQESN